MTKIIHKGDHGGDIESAMRLAEEVGIDAGKAEDWLDLSTGINPTPYPVLDITITDWHRLPEKSALSALLDTATHYYNAPSVNHMVAAPGSALLIQTLPSILDNQHISIVSPTYGDHGAAWARAGRTVQQINTPDEADPDGITIVVNPNNPDGRSYDLNDLKALAINHTKAGGWLIVDEAFGDLMPDRSASALTGHQNVIVLKSVGKFFGLAGMRLGFAIARPDTCARLSARLGAWAVSGPALTIGQTALQDTQWQKQTRAKLKESSGIFKELLKQNKLSILGGTDLFTLIESPDASALFNQLLFHKIYIRRFDYNPDWLRIGLVDTNQNLTRLQQALRAT